MSIDYGEESDYDSEDQYEERGGTEAACEEFTDLLYKLEIEMEADEGKAKFSKDQENDMHF